MRYLIMTGNYASTTKIKDSYDPLKNGCIRFKSFRFISIISSSNHSHSIWNECLNIIISKCLVSTRDKINADQRLLSQSDNVENTFQDK